MMMQILITTNDDGFLAEAEGVQGAFAEGDTPYEALSNLWDVLNMISEYRKNSFSRERFEKGISFSLPAFG